MTACDPGPAIDVLGGIPVIEPTRPEWRETDQVFNFEAQVKQADGDPILDSDKISVIASFRRVRHPDAEDQGSFVPLTAHRSSSNPLTFFAGATDFKPFLKSQAIEFFWVVELTQDNGNIVKLAETEPQRFRISCPFGPVPDLLADQNHVQSQFGGLDTIHEIHKQGYQETHNFKTFQGMGVAFATTDVIFNADNHRPHLGHPDLLMFRPRPATAGADAVDGDADEPYQLIGWAYAAPFGKGAEQDSRLTPGSPFTIDKRPRLGCIPYELWFAHEAGWHLLDGGFDVDETPDPEIGPPGFYHKRLWDVHVWPTTTGNNQVPRVTILNDVPQFGLSPNFGDQFPDNSFFVPPMQ
jgi:hypothetical protein